MDNKTAYNLVASSDKLSSRLDRGQNSAIELYGEEAGKRVKYAEAFEICEYGRRPSKEEILKLFPISNGSRQ